MARAKPSPSAAYKHPDASLPLRPDAGTQREFKKKKPPHTYRYDSSLSPALECDGQNPAREQGEKLLADLARISSRLRAATDDKERTAALADLDAAVAALQALGRPFLNWAGKAERLSFDVPTLPLFVHERLSTKGIIDTLAGHKKPHQQGFLFDLFGDPEHSRVDQVLKAYEYRDGWTNRLILGDSLVVMNSLLHYEGLGGQVQMIYMDPPYGVKFGSNFQPFVRKRDVKNNDDADMTREPETVKAYRDTWELGLHSYLTYLRDRLLLCRDLLHRTGSIFVQISDENVHHVREILDETFGHENFCAIIPFRKTAGANSPVARVDVVASVADYVLWYARNRDEIKYKQLYIWKDAAGVPSGQYTWVEFPGEQPRALKASELTDLESIRAAGGRLICADNLYSPGYSEGLSQPFEYNGESFLPPANTHWKTTPDGLKRLAEAGRLIRIGNRLRYKRYLDDFPVYPITNVWVDTGTSGFSDPKLYTVQTNLRVIQRSMLMTTDPGDLVFDPTCGSGTTAYAAEQWGRRWITTDVSRVPVALARQRLLTATYPWHELKDDTRGPAAGFVYKRKQNRKGEHVGGIVPHITLKSIANNQPGDEEVLVDCPETVPAITRVTGPFSLESTIPGPIDWDNDGLDDTGLAESHASFTDRMLEVLRRSPVLHLGSNRSATLKNVRAPARTLCLSAEALADADRPVAFVFGPENGPVSEKLVFEAAREANASNYAHLYVIGFAIEPNARRLVDQCEAVSRVPATYVQATPDLLMGDLLKNTRASQIFSVCGLPEIKLKRLKPARKAKDQTERFQVELAGLDVFDPVTMDVDHRKGADVPAWFLDTDYNALCFHVCQAFFPRTAAWDSLKRALKGTHDDAVWDHLAGTVSAPFEAGAHAQVAVKVIDDRGNELLVVKPLAEAAP